MADAKLVADYVRGLADFEIVEDPAIPYNHMGATIRRRAPGRLLRVRGIGPKTVDYFKILWGEQDATAIDTHLLRFLERAGVHENGYEQAHHVIAAAAPLLGVSAARLDHSIWTYMSKAGKTW
jgi:endonuclease III